ncbi:hypothetical protein ACJX0J_010723, partial [Zea mays]
PGKAKPSVWFNEYSTTREIVWFSYLSVFLHVLTWSIIVILLFTEEQILTSCAISPQKEISNATLAEAILQIYWQKRLILERILQLDLNQSGLVLRF